MCAFDRPIKMEFAHGKRKKKKEICFPPPFRAISLRTLASLIRHSKRKEKNPFTLSHSLLCTIFFHNNSSFEARKSITCESADLSKKKKKRTKTNLLIVRNLYLRPSSFSPPPPHRERAKKGLSRERIKNAAWPFGTPFTGEGLKTRMHQIKSF
eukprot:TRINITY_DN9061_c1_g2_i1.p1 TRINITY_DN9061_c1_g2~~TRINITY_DN9061_c1_g2_i1.p1  ORF type:complete len:154 (+),score=4.83 TRINITY_DN9061_c1_g2_i1:549-1010(+)